jgi:cytidylate kinase
MLKKKLEPLEVSSFVSKVATIAEVRAKLVEQQQEMGKNRRRLMDGRDIGTVVFQMPNLKYSLTSVQVPKQRRYDELIQKG